MKPLTLDERRALRRKPFWRVADFARYMGLSHWQAKSALERYDTELGGMLLRRSRGVNRMFGFYWAALAKHDPDAFADDVIELQQRLDDVEERVSEVFDRQRVLAIQTGSNTHEIAKLKARGRRVA